MSDSTTNDGPGMSEPAVDAVGEAVGRGSVDASARSELADGAKGPLSKPYRWLSIGMFSLIFLAAFETMAVTTIMPLVARDLDGLSLFAMAFAVPLAAGIVGMVLAGNWTDRAGPLPSLIASAVLFAIGLIVAGTAPNMVVFIVGRLVHGLAGAAVSVPLYVIVARVYPEALRARVFAGFAAAWVIPSIVGPAVAGVVAEAATWRWVFLGVIGLMLPAAAMMLPPILRVRDRVQGDTSVRWSLGRAGWSVLAAGAVLALSLAKELPEPWRWAIAGAALVLVVVAVRPLMPAGTLRAAAGLPATVLLKLIVAGAFYGSEIYLPYLLIERYEFSPSLAGLALTGAGVSWAVASWLLGRLGDRVTTTQSVQLGTGVLAASIVLVLLVAAFGLSPALAFVAWTLAGAAMGFMYPSFSVAVLKLSPKSAQGFNSAALSIGDSLGAAVALAVTAHASSAVAVAPFTAEFAVTVVIAAAAVVLAPRVRPRGEASARP